MRDEASFVCKMPLGNPTSLSDFQLGKVAADRRVYRTLRNLALSWTWSMLTASIYMTDNTFANKHNSSAYLPYICVWFMARWKSFMAVVSLHMLRYLE
jgi:predicted permease